MLRRRLGGLSENEEESTIWYTRAAERGHVDAPLYVGLSYYFGVGVAVDYSRAVPMLKVALDNGHVYAAQFLGSCYEVGRR